MEGTGVRQNFDKAEELFRYSYNLGNQMSMNSLVDIYLMKNDPDQALIWHTKALESNNMLSLTNNGKIMKSIEYLNNFKKQNCENVSNEIAEHRKNMKDFNIAVGQRKKVPHTSFY
jgi:TPR repeat protein